MNIAGVHRGMRVIGADGRRIGRVIRINDEDLILRSGFLHPKDYVAHRDRVAEVRGQRVFLTQNAAQLERSAERPEAAHVREAAHACEAAAVERGRETRRAEAERREDLRAEQRLTDDGGGIGERPKP